MKCLDCERILLPSKTRSVPKHLRPTHAVFVGRGLCSPCYQRNRHRGTLVDFERASHPGAELLADFEHLDLDRSLSLRQRFLIAAPRLGTTYKALEKAYYRALDAS